VAGSIATLWWVMFFSASALFILVIALFGWAYLKPGFASNTSPRTWLLHAGVIMPSVLLAALAAFAFWLGERLVARSDADVFQVEAIATRWAWHFRYPDVEAAPNSSVLHIPAGRTVEVRVISEDVIHSFWVPRLAGKIDAIPGHQTRVQLIANRPGEYEGVCAEFCGIGHTDMRFRVIAHAQDQYRSALLSTSP
jgi:cytochrome c oxidase subunit II